MPLRDSRLRENDGDLPEDVTGRYLSKAPLHQCHIEDRIFTQG